MQVASGRDRTALGPELRSERGRGQPPLEAVM